MTHLARLNKLRNQVVPEFKVNIVLFSLSSSQSKHLIIKDRPNHISNCLLNAAPRRESAPVSGCEVPESFPVI